MVEYSPLLARTGQRNNRSKLTRSAPFLVLIFASLWVCAANAQLTITGTTIADGQAGVAPDDSVHITFTLSEKLPFTSLFTTKFNWEPRGGFVRTYVFLDADRSNPRFTVTHRNNTDFAVYVFGVLSQQGNRMERPFTLNYSTSPSMGTRGVGGSVAVGTRTPPSGKVGLLIRQVHAEPANLAARALESTNGFTATDEVKFRGSTVRRERVEAYPKAGLSGFHAADEDRTVVLLLDAHNVNPLQWSVRAAAAVQANHSFQFSHVRDGEYYPVAVTWTDDTAEVVGAYGYYDPDGDFTPDPVVVSGGDVSGIDLTIYSYQTATGLADRFLAEDIAREIADDVVLVSSTTGSADSDGRAVEWTFRFYSPSLDLDLAIVVDPLTAYAFSTPSALTIAPQGVPPSGVIDSDDAVAIADLNGGAEFKAQHPVTTVSMRGGYALEALPDSPDDLIWSVTYTAGVGSPDPPLVVNLDMSDGTIKTGRAAFEAPAGFAVAGVYPNPFGDELTIEVNVPVRSDLRAEVYDVLGRRVGRISSGVLDAGTHILRWRANIAPGAYIVRINAGTSIVTRQVVKVGS